VVLNEFDRLLKAHRDVQSHNDDSNVGEDLASCGRRCVSRACRRSPRPRKDLTRCAPVSQVEVVQSADEPGEMEMNGSRYDVKEIHQRRTRCQTMTLSLGR
jgi:hypothetical protein